MFMGKMFEIIKRKKKQRDERKVKNVELWWLDVNPKIKEMDYVKKVDDIKVF
jgi:hypothetical protein